MVSVLESAAPPISEIGFLRRLRVACDDVDDVNAALSNGLEPPRPHHIQAVFRFADEVFGEPLLVHCMYGQSRSTAMALLLMMRDMKLDGFSAAECALESRKFLLSLRPLAKPNGLILDAGLCLLFDENERTEVRDAWRSV